MRKGILALIGMILTLVFIIVALVGPWYTGSGSGTVGSADAKFDMSMTLTKGETKTEATYQEETQTQTSEIKYDEDFDAKYVFDNTMYITIIALITAIIAMILILVMTFSSYNIKNIKMLSVIFGVLTLIFALVAPLYFMTALPNEMKDATGNTYGFWDSIDIMGIKTSMGPGFAWYLMIIAFITSLIATIVIFMDKQQAAVALPMR